MALLDYCQTDVDAFARSLPLMVPKINPGQAVLRGRCMKAVAVMERNGDPIDTVTHQSLRENWTNVQSCVVRVIDADYGLVRKRA
jgi:DNA polymerase-1